MATVDQFVAKLNSEYLLPVDSHLQDRFRGLLYEFLNPDSPAKEELRSTDGHAERAELGLPDTELTPDYLKKSSGIDGEAGDWTQAGRDAEGYPVDKGSATDVTNLPTQAEADAIKAVA